MKVVWIMPESCGYKILNYCHCSRMSKKKSFGQSVYYNEILYSTVNSEIFARVLFSQNFSHFVEMKPLPNGEITPPFIDIGKSPVANVSLNVFREK